MSSPNPGWNDLDPRILRMVRPDPAPAVPDLVDPLTGALARTVLVDRLAHALRGRAEVAVLLIDVDGFRAVNRALGYSGGDRLLTEVARRLAVSLREGDLVARFGGDEFAVLLPGRSTGDAVVVAERLQATLQAKLDVGGTVLRPTATFGVASRTSRHTRPEHLLEDAERALARARGRSEPLGRADEVTEPRAAALAQLEGALRRALDDEEFTSMYQPTLAVKRGQVAGFEILLWKRTLRPPV